MPDVRDSLLTHHLRILKNNEIIINERDKQHKRDTPYSFYSLSQKTLKILQNLGFNGIKEKEVEPEKIIKKEKRNNIYINSMKFKFYFSIMINSGKKEKVISFKEKVVEDFIKKQQISKFKIFNTKFDDKKQLFSILIKIFEEDNKENLEELRIKFNSYLSKNQTDDDVFIKIFIRGL